MGMAERWLGPLYRGGCLKGVFNYLQYYTEDSFGTFK